MLLSENITSYSVDFFKQWAADTKINNSIVTYKKAYYDVGYYNMGFVRVISM